MSLSLLLYHEFKSYKLLHGDVSLVNPLGLSFRWSDREPTRSRRVLAGRGGTKRRHHFLGMCVQDSCKLLCLRVLVAYGSTEQRPMTDMLLHRSNFHCYLQCCTFFSPLLLQFSVLFSCGGE